MADPLPKGVSETLPEGVYAPGTTPPKSWYQKVASMATEGMVGALFGSPDQPLPGGLNYPELTSAGRAAVPMLPFAPPPTEAGLGAAVGTAAAAPFTGGMSVPLGAAIRMLGGGIGAQAGALVSGEDPMSTALTYGAASGIGEAAGYGIGKILRSAPGAQPRIQRTRFDAVAESIADDLPQLRSLSFSEIKEKALSNSTGSLRWYNGDRLDAAIKNVDGLIEHQKVYVPSLDPKGSMFKSAHDFQKSLAEGKVYRPSSGSSGMMTLTDAIDELKEIAQGGFGGGKDMAREYPGKTAREVWQQALVEIKANLTHLNPTGEALTLFEASRQQWARTNAMINLLRITKGKGGDVFIGAPNRVDLNFNTLRARFERNYAKFESTMDPADFEVFKKLVYAGGPVGSRDILSRQQTMAGPVQQLLRSGGGTGTVGVLPARTFLTGLGDVYTGPLPYGSPILPTTLDIGSQRVRDLLRPTVEPPE